MAEIAATYTRRFFGLDDLAEMPWGSVPLMIACAVRFRAYVRGETLNEDTPILVPETGAEPVALSE